MLSCPDLLFSQFSLVTQDITGSVGNTAAPSSSLSSFPGSRVGNTAAPLGPSKFTYRSLLAEIIQPQDLKELCSVMVVHSGEAAKMLAAPSEKLHALILAESVISIVGKEWLVGQMKLQDTQNTIQTDRCILLVLESSRIENYSHWKLIKYVGRFFVKSSGKPIEILTKLNEMAGFNPDEEIEFYEIFPLNEKIENINDQYWTLRAEEAIIERRGN